jgi:hypothetical protein
MTRYTGDTGIRIRNIFNIGSLNESRRGEGLADV